MGILVECPNGHRLNLKDKYAGQSGYCPHCRAKVVVPPKEAFSETDIAAVLGTPEAEVARRPSEEFVHQDPRHDEDTGSTSSAISLLDSSLLKPQRVCTTCGKNASRAFGSCPTCGTPFETEPSSQSR